jgi:hypothetical protein
MSPRTVTSIARSLIALPAALLLQAAISGAAQADDLMSQQRDLLAGRVTVTLAPAPAATSATSNRGGPDAQELARRVILGSRTVATDRQTVSSPASTSRRHGDAQALARNVLLNRGPESISGS